MIQSGNTNKSLLLKLVDHAIELEHELEDVKRENANLKTQNMVLTDGIY